MDLESVKYFLAREDKLRLKIEELERELYELSNLVQELEAKQKPAEPAAPAEPAEPTPTLIEDIPGLEPES